MQTGQFMNPQMMQTGNFNTNPQMQTGMMPTMPNFRVEQLNWQSVHDVNLKDIKKNNDVEVLETFLPNIMNSTIDEDEFQMLKPETLLKLMEIMQLSLQYFDYTCDYLDNLAYETQDEISNMERKIKNDEQMLKKSKRDIQKQRNDIKIKKEALSKYKHFIKKKPALKCHICTNKFFENDDYFDAHMKRRHPQYLPMSADNPQFVNLQNMLLAQHLKQEQLDREIKGGMARQNQVVQNSDNQQTFQQQQLLQNAQQQQLQAQQQYLEGAIQKIEGNIQNFIQLNNQQSNNVQNNMEKKIDNIQSTNLNYYQQLLDQYNDMKKQNLELQKNNFEQYQQLQQYQQQQLDLIKQDQHKKPIQKSPQYQSVYHKQGDFQKDEGGDLSPIHKQQNIQNFEQANQQQLPNQKPKGHQYQQPNQQVQQQQQPTLEKLPTTYSVQQKDSSFPGQIKGVPSVYSEKMTGTVTNTLKMDDIMMNIPQNSFKEIDENSNVNNNQNNEINLDNISEDIERNLTDHIYDEDGFEQSENDLEKEKEEFAQRKQKELENRLKEQDRIAHLLVNPNPDSPRATDKKSVENTSRIGRSSLNQITENEEFKDKDQQKNDFLVPKGHEKFQSHNYMPQAHGGQSLKYQSGTSGYQTDQKRDHLAVSSELEDSELQFRGGGQFGQSSRFKGTKSQLGNKQEDPFSSQMSSQIGKKEEWENDSFERDLEGYKTNELTGGNNNNQKKDGTDFEFSDDQQKNQQQQALKNLYGGHESSSSYFE